MSLAQAHIQIPGRITLDRIFADMGHDPDLRAIVKRFVAEHGPKLQRLASIANDNAPCEWTDEAEFGDPFPGRITHETSWREFRAHDRWRWIIGLGWGRLKVWLFARPPEVWTSGPDPDSPWALRTPGLLDVLGEQMHRALILWTRELGSRCRGFVLARLKELEEMATERAEVRTVAGVLAAALAILLVAPEMVAAPDPGRDPPGPQVLAPGGQTARFAPLT